MSFHRLGKLKTFFLTLLVFVGLVGLFSLHSPVQAVSGNLVTVNHSFENNNFTGWTGTAGWTIQTTVVQGGSYAAKCVYSGTSCPNLKTQSYPITAGNTISFSIWAYTTAGTGSVTMIPNWTVSGSTVYGNPKVSMFAANQWKQLVLQEVAPFGATDFQVKIITSDITGSYYIDNAVVKDYGQDDFTFQYQDMNDKSDSYVGSSEGWVSGLDHGYTNWLDSSSVKQKVVRIKVFADENNNQMREDNDEGPLQSDIEVFLEKCSAAHTNSNTLNCTDWSDATKFTGYTDSTGTAVFNVRDDREFRATVWTSGDGYPNLQIEGVVRTASAIFSMPEYTTYGYTFRGVLRSVSDSLCDSTLGSHPCYKMYPSQGFVWLTGSGLSGYVNQRVGVKATNSNRTVSGVYYFSNTTYGTPSDKLIVNSPVVLGLGGGNVPNDPSDNFYDPFYNQSGTDALNPRSMGPGIYWASWQPALGTKTYQTNPVTAFDDLDGMMAACYAKGLSCPIYVGGVPSWAVTGALAKFGAVCTGAGVGNPFPLDPSAHQQLADFVTAIANRYSTVVSGRGLSGTYTTAKAPYIQIFNEPDWGSAFSGNNPFCDADPKYWSTVAHPDSKGGTPVYDLNNNGITDVVDYLHLFDTIHATVNGVMPINFGRWAAYGSTGSSAEFIAPLLIDNTAFDVMDLHYYDDQAPYWTDPVYNVKGIRGRIAGFVTLSSGNTFKPIAFSEMGRSTPTMQDPLQANSVFKETAQAYSTSMVTDLEWFIFSLWTGEVNWQYSLIALPYKGASPSVQGATKRLSFYAYQAISQELNNGTWRYLDRDTDDNVEGYIFGSSSDTHLKEVVWAGRCRGTCPTSPAPVKSFTASSIRVVKTNSYPSTPGGRTITDGETSPDVDMDPAVGKVGISLTTTNGATDPFIVQY